MSASILGSPRMVNSYLGVQAISAGTGITTNHPRGAVTISVANIYALSSIVETQPVSAGTGISVSSHVQVFNEGVVEIISGVGITSSGSTGLVTIGNMGVQSVTGGTGILVSASTGNVIINAVDVLATTGGSGISVVPSESGNIIVNNTGVWAVTGGSGNTVSSSTGNVFINNTGVWAVTGGSGVTVSSETGNIVVSSAGVFAVSGGSGVSVVSSTGNTVISTTGVLLGWGVVAGGAANSGVNMTLTPAAGSVIQLNNSAATLIFSSPGNTTDSLVLSSPASNKPIVIFEQFGVDVSEINAKGNFQLDTIAQSGSAYFGTVPVQAGGIYGVGASFFGGTESDFIVAAVTPAQKSIFVTLTALTAGSGSMLSTASTGYNPSIRYDTTGVWAVSAQSGVFVSAGTGNATISLTGTTFAYSSAANVFAVSGGSGISVSPSTGNVVLSETGLLYGFNTTTNSGVDTTFQVANGKNLLVTNSGGTNILILPGNASGTPVGLRQPSSSDSIATFASAGGARQSEISSNGNFTMNQTASGTGQIVFGVIGAGPAGTFGIQQSPFSTGSVASNYIVPALTPARQDLFVTLSAITGGSGTVLATASTGYNPSLQTNSTGVWAISGVSGLYATPSTGNVVVSMTGTTFAYSSAANVYAVTGGSGISVSPSTGNVVVSQTGLLYGWNGAANSGLNVTMQALTGQNILFQNSGGTNILGLPGNPSGSPVFVRQPSGSDSIFLHQSAGGARQSEISSNGNFTMNQTASGTGQIVFGVVGAGPAGTFGIQQAPFAAGSVNSNYIVPALTPARQDMFVTLTAITGGSGTVLATASTGYNPSLQINTQTVWALSGGSGITLSASTGNVVVNISFPTAGQTNYAATVSTSGFSNFTLTGVSSQLTAHDVWFEDPAGNVIVMALLNVNGVTSWFGGNAISAVNELVISTGSSEEEAFPVHWMTRGSDSIAISSFVGISGVVQVTSVRVL